MKRTTIKELYRSAGLADGQRIRVAGWVRSIRGSGAFGFVTVNDGSFFEGLQVVAERSRLDNYDEIISQNVGAALWFEGELRLTPEGRQPFELVADKAEIEGRSTPDYPLQKKRHSFEYLRTIAHLGCAVRWLSPYTNFLTSGASSTSTLLL